MAERTESPPFQARGELPPGAGLAGWLAALLLLALAAPAQAYVGPGAGFALLSSFLVVLSTIVIAILSLLIWPFRTLYRKLRRGRAPRPLVRRLVIVGLDGQDPRLTDRWMAEGKLPNFQRLAELGGYHRLRSTYPSISPVAWSSFSTGTHPAKHAIYDFLDRDLRTYLPKLSSTHIGKVERTAKLGRWRIPLSRPDLRLLRRSKPFWTLLGEKGIWSTVLRVPITFPPDKFYGAELSAMCVPDLLGSQGTFHLFTTRPPGARFKEGGVRVALEPVAGGGGAAPGAAPARFRATLEGPENLFREGNPPLALPVELTVDRAARRARITVGDAAADLEPGRLTDWVRLTFPAAPAIKVSGLARLQLLELGEHVSLYLSPINLDPEKPAMPISHPGYFATYLAKKIGPYATLGLAEDDWALNEGVIDDGTFLKLAHDIDAERQAMFFAALDRLRRGALVCVFDATDRIQHMFWRYLVGDHPALRGNGGSPHARAIEELYRKNDDLVGRVMARLGKGDLLIVLSDHGFTTFRRGVNLNRWLLDHGYLALKPGTDGGSEWLRDVDWSKTRVYAVGLTGMFLNLKGREAQGTVEPGEEARALKDEIVARLSGLRDEERKGAAGGHPFEPPPAGGGGRAAGGDGEVGIVEVFETAKLYSGPYLGEGPDFIIGYNHGYRVSWDCATGMVAGPVFSDNVRPWSGDHGVDPRLVPGVLFTSHPIDERDPALMDVAPTALRLFGLEPPKHMDGKPLYKPGPLAADPFGKAPAAGKATPAPAPERAPDPGARRAKAKGKGRKK